MPRRAAATIRPIEPDSIHRSKLVQQVINKVMLDGKKSTAERIVYDALAILSERTGKDPVEALETSIKALTPVLEGSIALRVGHEHRTVPAGESFDIPRGTVHTMGPAGGPARVRWEVRPALRTEEFLTQMPPEFADRLAWIQRFSEEFRLAGF